MISYVGSFVNGIVAYGHFYKLRSTVYQYKDVSDGFAIHSQLSLYWPSPLVLFPESL